MAGVHDRLQAMKWLLAQISNGQNMVEYFPNVVKNVIVQDVEVKKLVYIFLARYADHDAETRELALLSINSFQKDLASTNMLLRSLALRVMTSIKLPDIIELQIMAVSKCCTDSSPFVRKTACNALPKLVAYDPSQRERIANLVGKLLADSSMLVYGSAAAAFNEICPNRLDLIHPAFRKMCKMLPDLDVWGKVLAMNLLLRYGRTQFLDPRVDPKSGKVVAHPEDVAAAEAAASLDAATASIFEGRGLDDSLEASGNVRRASNTSLSAFYNDDEDGDEERKEAGEKGSGDDSASEDDDGG